MFSWDDQQLTRSCLGMTQLTRSCLDMTHH